MDKSLDNKLDKLEADLGGANPIVFRSPGSYRYVYIRIYLYGFYIVYIDILHMAYICMCLHAL